MENDLSINNENNEAIDHIEKISAVPKAESPSRPHTPVQCLGNFDSLKVKRKDAVTLVKKHM